MAKYVDIVVLKQQDFQDFSETDVWNAIDNCPAADVQLKVRGRWNKKWWGEASCSICNTLCNPEAKYCPGCGAKMDLDEMEQKTNNNHCADCVYWKRDFCCNNPKSPFFANIVQFYEGCGHCNEERKK